MYSHSSIAVDKGLGFDFSDISNLVKTALPVGLNIFNQQMQLKTIQTAAKTGVPVPALPPATMYGIQPTVAPAMYPPGYVPPSSGMDTSTIVLLGGAAVVGLLAIKMLKS
jgi:hypothetical protein